MSYCRFGWDGSDVYVYGSVHGGIECCGCHLDEGGSQNFETPEKMIEHLIVHRKAGDYVPEYAILRLWNDIEGADEPVRPEPEPLAEYSVQFDKIREDHFIKDFAAEAPMDSHQETAVRHFIKWSGMDSRPHRRKAEVDAAVMDSGLIQPCGVAMHGEDEDKK